MGRKLLEGLTLAGETPREEGAVRAASAGVVKPSATGGGDQALLPAGAHRCRPRSGCLPLKNGGGAVSRPPPFAAKRLPSASALFLPLWEGERERGRR